MILIFAKINIIIFLNYTSAYLNPVKTEFPLRPLRGPSPAPLG